MQLCPWPIQGKQMKIIGGISGFRRAVLGHGLSGQLVDFQRPDHPPRIVGMKPRSGIGIDPGEQAVHFHRAQLLQLGLQRGAHRGITGQAAIVHGTAEPLQIKARAAHQQGNMAPLSHLLDHDPGGVHVFGHREGSGGFHEVQQMMGHGGALHRCGLGGAYIHAAIDLHGIHAEDLAAQRLGDLQGQGGFAAGCGSDDAQYSDFLGTLRCLHISSVSCESVFPDPAGSPR